MSDRPFAYVCSPFRGDVAGNAERARAYCRQVFDAGYLPFAPHIYFPQFLNDDSPQEREAGMTMGAALLPLCRVLIVCGDSVSEGMKQEIQLAKSLGVEICSLENIPTVTTPKLYLSQIAKWLEFQTGAPQQIINTNEGGVQYVDYDSAHDAMDMTIIADAGIEIRSISWSGEYGLGLNIDEAGNDNGERVHVILWTDSETAKDAHGQYMDAEGALNGILVIQNPNIEVTSKVINEMLAIRDEHEPTKTAGKHSVLKQIADARDKEKAEGAVMPKKDKKPKSREEEL